MIKDKHRGIAAAAAANIIFGLNIPVTKTLMSHWMTPLGYTISRMFFGTAVFWLIGLFLQKEKVTVKDLIIMMIGGLVGYPGTQYLFSQSMRYTTPVIFSLLMALTPVVALLLSALFLNENVSNRKITGIIISISGAALVILSSGNGGAGSDNFIGIIFVIACVFAYSSYIVITRKISAKYNPLTIAKWMFLFSAVVLMPLSFSGLQGQRIYSSETTLQAISLLSYAFIFSTTLAFFFMPFALKRLEAGTVSNFMNLQPLVASVVAIGIGQDTFSWDKIAAAALVLTGVYLVTGNATKRFKYKKQLKGETI
ncbi:MAG: DMT family transporter [Desulfobacteraceae bacterium]|jgi:drug/metabolite transporter (DMT)-like permease